MPRKGKRAYALSREAIVLLATAALCATAIAIARMRNSRVVTESFPALFAAPKATHLAPPPATAAGMGPLVHPGNLVYEGAFRLPAGAINDTSFTYGGTAIAFNAVHQSLFIVGHDWDQRVTEIAIPEIRSSTSLHGLATAKLLQPFTDVTNGTLGRVGPKTVKIGGLLPYRGRLYLTAYLYYDASASQTLSHFVSSLDFGRRGEESGPFRVGTLGAGLVSGYFGLVPAAWQSALGGPVLNGNCCLGIISRTSYGPALFTIDPVKLAVESPLAATPLVYYPAAHPLAGWGATSPFFNGTTQIRGVVFHEGTRSVLFFGRQGLGPFCYGLGTTDEAARTQPLDPAGERRCFDPADGSKGTHGYPYSYYVWAYDANELAAVKAGSRAPWDVKPYATWSLTLPFSVRGSAALNGATYDAKSGRIFVSQAFGDGELPVIHVLAVRVF